jgi:hypothetical protein
MPVPWLQLVDAALGLATLARGRRAPSAPPEEQLLQLESGARGPGGLEARLAGVVVAALREAFERDTRRLDLERQQAEAERERAERALRLELQRQAADREIGRLRLLAGVAVTAWLGTIVMSARLIAGGLGARMSLGFGWLLLLGAIAASFMAQSSAAAVAEETTDREVRRDATGSSAAGAVALWLLLCGLVLVGVAALLT